MSEGSTLKPFPEARPPHLPDVATRQSPWLFLFGALIAVQIWRLFQGWDPQLNGANAVTAFNYVLSWAAAFAPPLMGFALFYRHPDARRRMPLLVFGILLLSLGELLSALDAPIRELLSNLTPPGDQESILDTPAEFAYRVFTGLLTIFGLLYLGAGLSTARSRPRARVERPLTVWLAALAFVAAVLSAVDLTRIQVDLTPFLGAQLIIGSIVGVIETFAWAYVTATVVNGWLAGELPRRAWALAGIAMLAIFGLRIFFPVLSLVIVDPNLSGVLALGYISYVSWLLLIAAFVLGLPTPTSASETEEADEPTGDLPAERQPGSAGG